MFLTFKTKIKNQVVQPSNGTTLQTDNLLHQMAVPFSRIERKLFVDLHVRKKGSAQLKREYCRKFQITSRQYNSIKNQIDGKVKSVLEVRKTHIEEIKTKIRILSSQIEKKSEQRKKAQASLLKMKGNEKIFEKKVRSYRRMKEYLHNKKRKKYRLKTKLGKLEKDEQEKRIRICFGSKELFHQQFHLEENNLTMKSWKEKWQRARSAQMTFLGSSDEFHGNQTCKQDVENNLHLRLDKEMEKKFGTHVVIPNVLFPYGQKHLDVAKNISKVGMQGKQKKNYYRAVTYKFLFQNNQWYLTATIDVDEPSIKTLKSSGCVGIDYNVGFLAVTETDRFGNPIHSFTVPFRGYDVSSEVAEQNLSHALKKVVQYALEKAKPIAFENLNFQKKKRNLMEVSKKQARMLSGLGYKAYQDMLDMKCKKAGVETTAVSPAYTSQIGHALFMKRYGLNPHCSAALVIARRGIGFPTEKFPCQCKLEKPKKYNRNMNRFSQWKMLTAHWKKKYTYNQKLYVLYRL